MGFDLKKAISKFSSKSQKQEKSNKTVTSTTEESNGSTYVAVKREERVSTTTTTTNNSNTGAHHARKQKRKVIKSVKFVDCDCDGNVKVAPYGLDSSSSTTKSVSSTPTPPPSSDTKMQSFEANSTLISSNEDPQLPRSPNSSIGSVGNENPANSQIRLPSPEGLHSRNLSYGTIYNASKTATSREYPPCSKDDRSNAKAISADKVNANQGTLAKPGRSMPHVFGLGGCNYGYGSIINGMKNLKSSKANSVVSSKKDDVGKAKQGPLVSSSCEASTVEELKSMGNGEYRKGQFKKAISFYDKAIGLDPCNAGCHHNKAAALACLGRIREAVEECLVAVNRDPSYSRGHYRLGTLYTRLGQTEDAKKHFKLSGHMDSSEAVQRMLAVEGYLQSMKRAMKIEDWERVILESSHSLKAGADACDEAIAAKAEALLKLHRVNEALEILMAAKNTEGKKPRRSRSHLLLLEVQIYLYLGRFEEAVRSAEEAVNTEFDTDSLLQLKKAWGAADAHRAGNEYYNAGKFSEACAMYAQGLRYIPTNGFLLYKRATCRIKIGQWERAVEDLNAALKNNPNHPEALPQRAQALTELARWEDALRDYLVLRKQKPTDHTVSNSLLQVQMELKGTGCHLSTQKI